MARRGIRSKEARVRRYKYRVNEFGVHYGAPTKIIPSVLRVSDRTLSKYTPKWIRDAFPIETVYGSDWNDQRDEALKRDNYVCQYEGCNETQCLHVHHINPRRISNDNSLDNLITLCEKHHSIVEAQAKVERNSMIIV